MGSNRWTRARKVTAGFARQHPPLAIAVVGRIAQHEETGCDIGDVVIRVDHIRIDDHSAGLTRQHPGPDLIADVRQRPAGTVKIRRPAADRADDPAGMCVEEPLGDARTDFSLPASGTHGRLLVEAPIRRTTDARCAAAVQKAASAASPRTTSTPAGPLQRSAPAMRTWRPDVSSRRAS